MKAFLTTTPKMKTLFPGEFTQIVSTLKKLDLDLVDETILQLDEKDFYSWTKEKLEKFYEGTIKSIRKADVCIFEASLPSVGIGHLVNQAVNFGKPVIVLYLKDEGKRPSVLESAHLDKVVIVEYTTDTVKEDIEYALDYVRDNMDIRFNFFISPALSRYLDWMTKQRNIPRSVFLRSLIETAMKRDPDYSSKS